MSACTRQNHGLKILGISLALLNFGLWHSAAAIRGFVDHWTGRWDNDQNPRIVGGVQELFVYFDPWPVLVVFLVYTLGFAAIPFLMQLGEAKTGARPGQFCSLGLALILMALEAVWLLLVAMGIFLRGPNWSIFWPGEKWDPQKVEPLNRIDVSRHVWEAWMNRPVRDLHWAVRELPGLAFLAVYLAAGTAIAFGLYRASHRTIPYWRCLAVVLLLQLAALVPIKVFLYWGLNVRYLIYIPEFFCNL